MRPTIPVENRWTWQGVTTIVMLAGLIMGLGSWRGTQEASVERIPTIESTQSNHAHRITALETSVRYTDTKFAEILRQLERIDAKLDSKADKDR